MTEADLTTVLSKHMPIISPMSSVSLQDFPVNGLLLQGETSLALTKEQYDKVINTIK